MIVMYDKVALSGSSTRYPGTVEFMTKELTALVPSKMKIKRVL